MSVLQDFLLRICSEPTHIDARERITQYTWTASNATLIFDNDPKFGGPNSYSQNRSWSWGISRKFGYTFIFFTLRVSEQF